MVILPFTLIASALAREASGVYRSSAVWRTGSRSVIPADLRRTSSLGNSLLHRLGLATLGGLQVKRSSALLKGSQFLAAQALNIGQSTFGFLCEPLRHPYLLFFLFRDENTLSKRVKERHSAAPRTTGCSPAQFMHRHPRDGQRRLARRPAAMSTGRLDVLVSGHQMRRCYGRF